MLSKQASRQSETAGDNACKMKNRIEELRVKHDLSQEKLGQRFGIKTQGMGKIEKKDVRELKVGQLLKLSKIFNVHPWQIVQDHDPEQIDGLDKEIISGLTFVDGYREVRASMGHGIMAPEGPPDYRLAFRTESIRNLKVSNPKQLFVIGVEGDSMEPTLHTDDTVLADKGQTTVGREGIYVIVIENELCVKRLQYNPQTKIIKIISDNSFYPVMEITNHDSFRIVGRVVWMGRRV